MIEKYKASRYTNTIQRFVFGRETKARLMQADGMRGTVSKMTTKISYFDTHQQAKNWLIEGCQTTINIFREELQLAQSALGNVKGLRP